MRLFIIAVQSSSSDSAKATAVNAVRSLRTNETGVNDLYRKCDSLDNDCCLLFVVCFLMTYATATFILVLVHGGPNCLRRHESQKDIIICLKLA